DREKRHGGQDQFRMTGGRHQKRYLTIRPAAIARRRRVLWPARPDVPPAAFCGSFVSPGFFPGAMSQPAAGCVTVPEGSRARRARQERNTPPRTITAAASSQPLAGSGTGEEPLAKCNENE